LVNSEKSSKFAAGMMKRWLYILIGFALLCGQVCAAQTEVKQEKAPTKGLLFFYRIGDWANNYLRQGIDTNYIDLPEHSWRVAATLASSGINSRITSISEDSWSLLNGAQPSVDVGFYAGYRGIGFGYSWDVLHAYSRRLSFSFGSKYIGIDFSLQTTSDLTTRLAYGDEVLGELGKNLMTITNANLGIWYALNSAHYSHNAAVKQSYIQKKTAGSLLLHLSYMSNQIHFRDTLQYTDPVAQYTRALLPTIMSGMTGMTTRQIAVGVGYGINYTPNKGKVVLHASAACMLVCYSVNHIMYYLPDSLRDDLPSGEPMFVLHPAIPVHVTGNVRAAVSWEINKWVHLSAWATGDHLRFHSAPAAAGNTISLANWSWKAQLNIGVRFGAGQNRLERALGKPVLPQEMPTEIKKSKLPRWLTDFFWSPK
jgi:hypothetical protein